MGILVEIGAKPTSLAQGPSLDDFTGGLFTVLPLNKPISDHPVHLHGLFSLTSDRSNLHSVADESMQDPNPYLWNEMLFSSLFPVAWTKLLSHLCRTRPEDRYLMRFWPREHAVVDRLGENMCQKVFDIVALERLSLFS